MNRRVDVLSALVVFGGLFGTGMATARAGGKCPCFSDVMPCGLPDGTVDPLDVDRIVSCVINQKDVLCGEGLSACDVNCDGMVTWADASAVYLQSIGFADSCNAPSNACCDSMLQEVPACVEVSGPFCAQYLQGEVQPFGVTCIDAACAVTCTCNTDVFPCGAPDGITNLDDVNALRDCVMNQVNPCGGPLQACDVNCDGEVNDADWGAAILAFQNHPAPCDQPTGACCSADASGCTEVQGQACNFIDPGANFQGEFTVCAPGACDGCLDNVECDDGLFCNGPETCDEGVCMSGIAPCAVALCDEAMDVCHECVSDGDCQNDNLFCNGFERCEDNVCVVVSNPCPDQLCNEDTDICVDCLVDGDCDNGLFCDGAETCNNGSCVAGSAPCQGQLCDENNDACVDCFGPADCDDGQFCNGAEACSDGACVAGSDPCPGQLCNEGTDSCFDCVGDGDCDNGQFCDGTETCDDGMCVAGADPCPGQICAESSDSCFDCFTELECDDGQFCNGQEVCNAGFCGAGSDPCPGQFCDEVADTCFDCNNGSDCDDGLFCNGVESCNGGNCVAGADPCPGMSCNENTDTCVDADCVMDSECDDGNACTNDTCENNSCVNVINYNDLLACCNPNTGALNGLDDGNVCTVDSCDPDTGEVTHNVPPSNNLCASGVGSRAIAATPPCGTGPECNNSALVGMLLSVEVEVDEQLMLIDLGYIQPDGTIGEVIALDTPANWGTVTIARSGLIRPSTLYEITLVTSNQATASLQFGGSSSASTTDFGDIDANGVCNFNDILLGVFAFQGRPEVEPILADIEPCVPNEVINLADVFRAVLCFRGVLFEDVCPTGVCCVFPSNPCGSCSNQFGFEWFEDTCDSVGGIWTEDGECGPLGECPGAVCP